MTLSNDEFIRRFLIHILPAGFHRIRHYGLFASHLRRANLAQIRQYLNQPPDDNDSAEISADRDQACPFVCRTCGEPMKIVEILSPTTRAPPS